ncbi:glucose-1-phosphate cytidylyltransferase [Waterburya agarophytonicola K14]|uniref:Glucose-1-phosphate cytidylyltransferase n=1 Tax=Waterburya agarophytonicola KI4 TaxID=2874699 RepID=A0A964BPA1_9CYAN|nr:glucose-1-phosphate cytidylyltransferase [Waterburya agarophytonicola]MCC0176769.1 glucose-1-phosphate cytidylyltransferase [Waterburya agarophytonicola KI4]
MKVVLFCGGFGTRLREHSETIPKPMVDIGYRPIIWHLMRYYAHFGHKDFILCLGYRGDYIKNYFLNYNECLSNNFVLSNGGRTVHLYNNDIEDWRISFIDTGLQRNIGERLMAVKPYLEGERMFLANYADGLSDLDLNLYLDNFEQSNKIASFLCVQPSQSFHVVAIADDSLVEKIEPVIKSNLWINGGFFAFKPEIFDYIESGEELVVEPFQRLIAQKQLLGYRNPGFWACMDTLKEKMMFDEMYNQGEMPWAVWDSHSQAKKNGKSAPNPSFYTVPNGSSYLGLNN